MAADKKSDEKKQKAKRPTAIKRDMQNEKHRLLNKSFKSQVRTSLKSFDDALKGKDKNSVQNAVNLVYSLMDRGVKKNLFKKNKAARTKSRVASKLTAFSS